MRKIGPFTKSKTKRKLIPVVIFALIVGAVIGFYFPDSAEEYDFDFFKSNSEQVVGDVQGHAVVTDGDTLKVNGTRIRFHGIDAPELNQPCWIENRQYQCGVEARAYLSHIINNQAVNCFTQTTDQYGRKIAQCYNYKNEDIEALMVSAGMAVAYTYYSYDYIIEEIQARINNEGIWAGEFQNPYNYRQSK